MGQDEKIDLTSHEQSVADRLIGEGLSAAAAYRQARSSQRGLLLIYPIQTTDVETESTVIGLAVSLPSSIHDSGCDYVCNQRTMRELFGAMDEDLERDRQEEEAQGAENKVSIPA